MHVGTVVCSGAEPSDVELAQFLLLQQLNVMAEVAVVPLVVEKKKVWIKSVHLEDLKPTSAVIVLYVSITVFSCYW